MARFYQVFATVTLMTCLTGACIQRTTSKQPRRTISSEPSKNTPSNITDDDKLVIESQLGQNHHINYRFCSYDECPETIIRIDHKTNDTEISPPDPDTTRMFVQACATSSSADCEEWQEIALETDPLEFEPEDFTAEESNNTGIIAGSIIATTVTLSLGGIVFVKYRQLQSDQDANITDLKERGANIYESLRAKANVASNTTTSRTKPLPILVFDLDETIGAGTYKGIPGVPPLKPGSISAILEALKNGHRIGIATANTNNVQAHLMHELGLTEPDDVELFKRMIKVEQPKWRFKFAGNVNIREFYKTGKGEMVAKLWQRFVDDGYEATMVVMSDDKPDYLHQVSQYSYSDRMKDVKIVGMQVGDYSVKKTSSDHPEKYNKHMQFAHQLSSDPNFLAEIDANILPGEQAVFDHEMIKNLSELRPESAKKWGEDPLNKKDIRDQLIALDQKMKLDFIERFKESQIMTKTQQRQLLNSIDSLEDNTLKKKFDTETLQKIKNQAAILRNLFP